MASGKILPFRVSRRRLVDTQLDATQIALPEIPVNAWRAEDLVDLVERFIGQHGELSVMWPCCSVRAVIRTVLRSDIDRVGIEYVSCKG